MLSKRRRSRIMKYPSIYAPSENGAFKRRDIFAKRPASIQRPRLEEKRKKKKKKKKKKKQRTRKGI